MFSYQLELHVVGGSGYFELQPPDNDIATLDYHEAKKTVTVSTEARGSEGGVILTLFSDLV